mgnify:CR=1 FL=1
MERLKSGEDSDDVSLRMWRVDTVCVHSIGFNTGTQESEVRKKQYRCHAVYWTHPVLRRDRHMGNDQGANTLKKE